METEVVVGLLRQLLSDGNEVRNSAEKSYQDLSMTIRVPALLNILGTVNPAVEDATVLRTLAAVLLRRTFVNEFTSFEKEASAELMAQTKSTLLSLIASEPLAIVRKRVCDIVAELARCMQDDAGTNLWPEVLTRLFEFGSSDRPELRDAALHIISSTPTIFGSQRTHYIAVIKTLLARCLGDQTNSVRYSACKATTAFVGSLRADPCRTHFADMVPALVQVTEQSVTDSSADDSALQAFLDFCQRQPRLLRQCLDDVVALSLKIASTADLEEKVRQFGLEIVITLAEEAPAMVRKRAGKYLQNIVQQVLAFMVDVDDDETWGDQDTPDEGDDTSNSVYAESGLDRLAVALGGNCILPLMMGMLGPMLGSTKWEHRYGALLAVSAMAEGCHKQMLPHLQEILQRTIPFLQDAHPRVRYSACNAIGQMGVDLAQDIQRKYHNAIIPALLMVIESQQTLRVQEHAFQALVNFISYLPQYLLTPYLSPIAIKVEEMFGRALDDLVANGRKMVLQAIIMLITTLADVADKQFEPHYERFMPRLKFLLQNAVGDDLRTLRGKAIECITTIGAATPDKLRPDVQPIMDLLVHILRESNNGQMDPSDPQIAYMISAWPRMASILQQDFVPYLQMILPMTIAAAELQPEVVVVDSDEAKEQFDEKDGWQFMTLTDQQKFGLKTAGLQEKATACETITSFVRELGVGFSDNTVQVANVMRPLLKFYFDETVRQAAAECLPLLLSSVKPHGEEALLSLWQLFRDDLFSACEHEPERPVLSCVLCSLSDCVEVLGTVGFDAGIMTKLISILHARLEEYYSRKKEREAQRGEEDHDEDADEDLEMERECDEQVLAKVTDVLHALFSVHKAELFPFFDQLVPIFTMMLKPELSAEEHQWALCVFDDVIEFGGAESLRYQQFFLEPMIAYVLDESAEVRQAAAYGIGIMALHGGESYFPACVNALPHLAKACSAEVDPSDYMSCCAYENAVSAVAKVCRHLPEAMLNLAELLPLWLSWLPVISEDEEAPHVYEYLCQLIVQNNVHILGDNHANLPRIVSIFTRALSSEVLTDCAALADQMLAILKQVQSSPETWQAICTMLPQEEQAMVAKLLPTTS